MTKEIEVYQPKALSVFQGSAEAFELAQRQSKALAESDLVPSQYKGKLANCLVALEVAQRTGASALAVMQSLHVINGRPSWSSQYIIAAINSCGRFAPLRFKLEGSGDTLTCTAWTSDKSGEVLEGPAVSIAMAKAEGWYQKQGSKWQTMPELMIRYRAAAFFGRLYAPEILLGMRTEEEERDIIDVTPRVVDTKPSEAAAAVNEKIRARRGVKKDAGTAPPEAAGPTSSGGGVPNGDGNASAAATPPPVEGHF
jgi:hypothetical protein